MQKIISKYRQRHKRDRLSLIVQSGSVLEKMGIKSNDKIISYDGQAVNSATDSIEMFNKLKSNSVKTIVIERNGKKQTLTYQIN
jgi:general secretion pathway protein C